MEKIEEKLKNAFTIQMTESERSFMRSNIISFMNIHDIRQGKYVKSPYTHFWNPLLVTLCSIMFIVASGGTVSYSASDALPGDKLYNFKVKINEEVQGILITSPTQKIMWQQNRVAKRIDEVKKLAENGDLTEERASIAERAIEEHIAKVDANVKILAKENPEDLIKTAGALNDIISVHDKNLKELEKIEESNTTPLINKDGTIKENIDLLNDKANLNKNTQTQVNPTTTLQIEVIDNTNLSKTTTPIITTEPVLEKSVNSNTLNNIISKLKKESEAIYDITKQKTNDVIQVESSTEKIEKFSEKLPQVNNVTQ